MTKQLPRVLNYHGSKYSMTPWILAHMPPHDCFVDAFGGSGSLFTAKKPVLFEVYNDKGQDISNFFRVLREQPEELARVVACTPWSREEFNASFELAGTSLEQARRLLVRSWQSRGTPPLITSEGQWKSGWRYQRSRGEKADGTPSRGGVFVDQWSRIPDAILVFADRMKHVQLEQDDAVAVIKRFDDPQALIYADPPYLPETRSRWRGHAYEVEMDEADHVRLADVMNELNGYGIVSGYASELYRDLYEG